MIITLLVTCVLSGIYLNGTYKQGIFARTRRGLFGQFISVLSGQAVLIKRQKVLEAIQNLSTSTVFYILAVGCLTFVLWKAFKYVMIKRYIESACTLSPTNDSIDVLSPSKPFNQAITPQMLLKITEPNELPKHPKHVYIEDEACDWLGHKCVCSDHETVQAESEVPQLMKHPDHRLIEDTDNVCDWDGKACACVVKPNCLKDPSKVPEIPMAPVLINTAQSICVDEELTFNYKNALSLNIGTYASDKDVVWRVLERKNVHMDLIIPKDEEPKTPAWAVIDGGVQLPTDKISQDPVEM